jgi:inner membrane protein
MGYCGEEDVPMATPVGHSLAGYFVFRLSEETQGPDKVRWLLLYICLANAPDLDFLPGVLVGRPGLYHQGISHSLGFALVVSLAVAGVCRLWGKSFAAIFALSFTAYVSHIVIDFLGSDTRPPYGIPLLWPISAEHFISPVPIFWGVHHAGPMAGSMLKWLGTLFHPYNVGAIALEVVLLLPFILLSYWRRSLLLGPQRLR